MEGFTWSEEKITTAGYLIGQTVSCHHNIDFGKYVAFEGQIVALYLNVDHVPWAMVLRFDTRNLQPMPIDECSIPTIEVKA